MFTKAQLEFLRASLAAKGSAIPCDEGAASARLYVSVVDEVNYQLDALKANEQAVAQSTLPPPHALA